MSACQGILRPQVIRALIILAMGIQGMEAGGISIEAGPVALEFLPERGGRLTEVTFRHSPNLLAVAREAMSGVDPSVPVLERDFDTGGGMTVWLAPQRAWWADQSVHPSRLAKLADWPPDPYGEAASFSPERIGAAAVRLVGPDSPVTGMRLSKTARIDGDGIIWDIEARNAGTTSRFWAVWPNIRVPLTSEIYVESSPPMRRLDRPWLRHSGAWTIISGEAIPPGRSEKIGFEDYTGRVAVIFGRVAWMIFSQRAEPVPPGHAPFEIYVNADVGSSRCIEVEPLGSFHEVAPGDAIRMGMLWGFRDLPPDLPDGDRLRFVRESMDQWHPNGG